MSNLICPWCNHSNITTEGRNHYCNYCCYEWKSKPTAFNQITASPEVLAPKLVYSTYTKIKKPLYDWKRRQIANRWVLHVVWGSSVTDETYSTKAEAISATVKKLKEVEK